MKAWFISDIHLKSLNERNSHILLRFLLSLKNQECTHLFLVGDIFDFWVGDDPYFYKKFKPIIDAIVDLKRKGVLVFYFEGNHDVHIHDFWSKIGVPVFHDDEYFELDNKLIRVSHGDLINTQDVAYHRYRKVYRHKITEKITRAIPGEVFDRIGEAMSQYSRKKSSRRRKDQGEDLRKMIREYAHRSYDERKFDYVITGHMHVKDEYQFQSTVSINLGSWFDEPSAFWLSHNGHGWEKLG